MDRRKLNLIMDAIKDCTVGESINSTIEIKMDEPEFNDLNSNHFIVALKPEMTRGNDTDIREILMDISDTFERYLVNIGAVKIVPSDFLKCNEVMRYVYPTLYSISVLGLEACSIDVQRKLYELLQKFNIEDYLVLGSFQFLESYPQFSSLALETFSRNLNTYKLGNGCYCVVLSVQGKNIVVLNPFHPFQRDWFHTDNSCLVVFECKSQTNYKVIRKKCIGELEPQKSPEDSLKRLLSQKKYNIDIVNTAYNGYHVSPCLLEGMRLILYFFLNNDISKVSKTFLGKELLANGFSESEIDNIISIDNICFTDENKSIYDLTEFMDNDQVIQLLKVEKNKLVFKDTSIH